MREKILTRLLFAIGKNLTQCSKTSDRVLYLIAGAGIIAFMNFYTINLIGIFEWVNYVSSVFLGSTP